MMSALKLCKCHCVKALCVFLPLNMNSWDASCLPATKEFETWVTDYVWWDSPPKPKQTDFWQQYLAKQKKNRSLGIANTSLISLIYRNTSIFVNNHVDHLLHHETWILDAIKPTLTDRVRGMFGIMGSGAAPRKSFVNRKYKSIKQRNARKRKNRKQKFIKEE